MSWLAIFLIKKLYYGLEYKDFRASGLGQVDQLDQPEKLESLYWNMCKIFSLVPSKKTFTRDTDTKKAEQFCKTSTKIDTINMIKVFRRTKTFPFKFLSWCIYGENPFLDFFKAFLGIQSDW